MERAIKMNSKEKNNLIKEAVKTCTLEVEHMGFTVWSQEVKSGQVNRHWLIDASNFYEDGTIRISTDSDDYPEYEVVVKKLTAKEKTHQHMKPKDIILQVIKKESI